MNAEYYESLVRGRNQTIELLGRQLTEVQAHAAEDRKKVEAANLGRVLAELDAAYCPDLSNLLVEAANVIRLLAASIDQAALPRFSERHSAFLRWSLGKSESSADTKRAFDDGIRVGFDLARADDLMRRADPLLP